MFKNLVKQIPYSNKRSLCISHSLVIVWRIATHWCNKVNNALGKSYFFDLLRTEHRHAFKGPSSVERLFSIQLGLKFT